MKIKKLGGIDTNKLFQAVILGFLLVEGLSWIVSSLVPSISLIQGGWFLFLILFTVIITTLYTVGKNINQLELKHDGIFIALVFIAVALLFIILPEIVPQIFSTSGLEFRRFLIEKIGNVAGLGGTGVVDIGGVGIAS